MDIPETQTLVDKLAHKKFFIALFTNWLLSKMYSPDDDWKLKAAFIVAMVGVAGYAIYCQMKLDAEVQDK
jgi:hypothetical protein